MLQLMAGKTQKVRGEGFIQVYSTVCCGLPGSDCLLCKHKMFAGKTELCEKLIIKPTL